MRRYESSVKERKTRIDQMIAIMGGIGGQLVITIVLSLVVFLFFWAALSVKRLMGYAVTRRCACKEAKRIMKIFEERRQSERTAAKYHPETVDPGNLPLVD